MRPADLLSLSTIVDSWSATRADKAHSITAAARRLAATRGFDDFTLDDLAAEAGVSRRTLFNYFPGKMDAVLGLPPVGTGALIDVFRSGGPSGDLLSDAMTVALAMVGSKQMSRDELHVMHAVMEQNPKVLVAAIGHFRQIAQHFAEIVAEREHIRSDDPRAVCVVSVLISTFETGLDRYARADDDRGLAQILEELIDTSTELFRERADHLHALTTH